VREPESQNRQATHDLIVVSDLHLGEGLHADEPRYSPTEDFYYDQQFANFLAKIRRDYQHDPSKLILVFNGDTLDFLTITRTPSYSEAELLNLDVTPAEKKFGLNPTSAKSVYKLDVIVQGHHTFFQALAEFISAGHRVEILRGNHDLELFFPAVKNRLLDHIAGFADGLSVAYLKERVQFHEWFYLEPGRVFIEHGNQYDSANSNRYPLRPILPPRRWWQKEEEETLDYPLGSIFVRFFYNRVRQLDPYSPRLLSFDQYVDLIRRYNLFDVWRVYRDHYPHFLEALAPATPTTTGSSKYSEKQNTHQEAMFDELAEHNQYGYLYRKLNKVKVFPTSATKPYVVKEMVAPLVRRSLWFGIFAFVALFVWFGILQLIGMVTWITANAFLMSLFAVMSFGGAYFAWMHLQRKLQQSLSNRYQNHIRQAESISEFLDVEMILMGHNHIVEYRKINNGKAVYANSGTWTTVENPWTSTMRDARRFTFLHVWDHQVALKRWNDNACRIDAVPLLYVNEDTLPSKLSSYSAFKPVRTGEHSWLPSATVDTENEDLKND
jgi:UDP-2,3-diacylglucosamine pyrophosphatase LpxH